MYHYPIQHVTKSKGDGTIGNSCKIFIPSPFEISPTLCYRFGFFGAGFGTAKCERMQASSAKALVNYNIPLKTWPKPQMPFSAFALVVTSGKVTLGQVMVKGRRVMENG